MKNISQYEKSCYDLIEEKTTYRILKVLGIGAGLIVTLGTLYFIAIVLFSL